MLVTPANITSTLWGGPLTIIASTITFYGSLTGLRISRWITDRIFMFQDSIDYNPMLLIFYDNNSLGFVSREISWTDEYIISTFGNGNGNDMVYVQSIWTGNLQVTSNPPTVPISNICFIAGTPMTTDQGNIPIEKIDTLIHTIRNKQIVAITQTVTQDKYLVCFEKDALGNNIPSQKTIISKNHKLFYNGKMRMAREFLKDFSNVVKVKYTGAILYNVLLEEPNKMMVNNLICETLHPENGVAKVYMALQKLDTEGQQSLIQKINAHVLKNNVFNSNKKMIK